MPFLFKRLVLFLSIAAALAADKEPPAFRAEPAASYPHHQTNDKVTIAVDPFVSGEKVQAAFGKLNPYSFGVLPVLVVIQNDGEKAIRLDSVHAVYTGPQGDKVDATPASEVKYLRGPRRPDVVPGPTGGVKVGKGKKNPLAAWEIEGRAFAAKMLPASQAASGFFYFQTGLQRGATLYLSGLADAKSGQELFYFEIPLDESH
jgi:hypothetical protein